MGPSLPAATTGGPVTRCYGLRALVQVRGEDNRHSGGRFSPIPCGTRDDGHLRWFVLNWIPAFAGMTAEGWVEFVGHQMHW